MCRVLSLVFLFGGVGACRFVVRRDDSWSCGEAPPRCHQIVALCLFCCCRFMRAIVASEHLDFALRGYVMRQHILEGKFEECSRHLVLLTSRHRCIACP
mmetsp:Transcript_12805/g.23214  ORF Transcript_12805/g.23214 Transcript_12805/m.23214 type:complete len:99 (-) Transcript_12805:159-455(-)